MNKHRTSRCRCKRIGTVHLAGCPALTPVPTWRQAYIEKPLYQAVDVAAEQKGLDTTGFLNSVLQLGLNLWRDAEHKKERSTALIVTPEEHTAAVKAARGRG